MAHLPPISQGVVQGLDKSSPVAEKKGWAKCLPWVDKQARLKGGNSHPSGSEKGMISENVPHALLYFIDILIKTGAPFGKLCSEVEITLTRCPGIKLMMNGGLGFSYVSWCLAIPAMHDDVKTVYEFLLARDRPYQIIILLSGFCSKKIKEAPRPSPVERRSLVHPSKLKTAPGIKIVAVKGGLWYVCLCVCGVGSGVIVTVESQH